VKSFLHPRLSAWLCLALMLLAGLSPAQGFVVCIEADGCVSVEVKNLAALCGGCEGHEEDRGAGQVEDSSGNGTDCPCIDLAVPGSSEEQLNRLRAAGFVVAGWLAPAPESCIPSLSLPAFAGRGPPADVPRVADSLAHHRSVVLLV
jgi:hypothetical protein